MAKIGKNKYVRYLLLKESEKLAPHLPETIGFSQSALWEMLSKYSHVILKPVIGQRGKGIIKVSSMDSETYEIHSELEKTLIRGKNETYEYLLTKIGNQSYMIQYRIALAEINGCPIDLRVMVQRKKIEDPWKVTGKAVKVAGSGFIVTNNERSNGTILSVKEAMEQLSINKQTKRKILKKIDQVTIDAVEVLTQYMPNHRAFGFDIGIDNTNHIWIIEANRSPMVSHFKKLSNQRQYERIMRYKKGE
ncbi:YheC/YheD family protein [Alkalihalobacillus sp. MEB130]|uniref:YheC/YheD family protein n=1 Tax=Alkalihalobacillus sp. MEB130 TaxID=2976704 RepID=UPI0028DE6CF6|nr:YheC/YheD family protein [Alkalihalobacillus sp. MEB130]MDT8861220.1 YheC/YheD family protein [Alkalihalobacillus sp. MEB130]